MIDIKNVTKVFKGKKKTVHAVDDVSLHIEKGEIFGIIGYSGAGKSTLIRMLNGLETLSSGDVVIGGDTINTLSKKALRKKRQKVSMIFQHFNLLWSRTVYENIRLPLEIAGVSKSEMDARVTELIHLVGLEGREHNYPSELSGGQKQRVGIARALSNHPEVLLCDEATSALDPQTTDEILDLLVKIREELGLTIVMITHEMQVIRKICDRAAVMENGKVIEVAPIIELFQNPKSSVTKRFVQDDLDDEDVDVQIKAIKESFPNSTVLKLGFVGTKANRPIVSQVIKTYDLDMNVLSGNIKQTNDESYGHLYVATEVQGETLTKIIEQFERENVSVEVIK
ncbi:methionine ABC transporter ATP-binding protein [Nosocomiicoccus ampullae]|uniref:methionine ABC transporter ATP-binding protein n=1 Tax=Nosocomiicoccus ampullae TaxID=489910 RepID=UPI00254AD11A|nr:methionine ABC transporter ATP-binding protein [Nosocomiicoccus ampullae]MDK6863957.1 methionine ABC transporter ATP-binding protein [Nosocomiicoccus ampullae]